ncbi:MAG: 3'(2'),5'-bisphosphate nucleotidase CysQ [Polyangiaceae bacterium]|nr:3'(2'),5'-bisphosphate nucleotidase CysQ [Polyangiaceae bacterium]MCW5792159.1 3'(2'),5'-bisphosphate nucleotidase CysQ [Polyangiaceae bacterium]
MTRAALTVMHELACRAAELIRAVYQTDFQVDYKAPTDPVTQADRQANELIVKGLRAAFPDAAIVAEESDAASYADFRAAERVFFVDPLDGTREFVDKNGEFVVMLGLIEGARAVAGVIHAPVLDVAWLGLVGEGAWEVDAQGARRELTTSRGVPLREARVVASRTHRTEDTQRALDILGVGSVSALGSAGLKGAEVARGLAEAYASPGTAGKRWDACAVDALVTAAGGQVSDAFGDPIDYRGASLTNSRGLVATNGELHRALLERLEVARVAFG